MILDDSLVRRSLNVSMRYMVLTAVLAMILGLIMLFFPGGTMALMQAAFFIFQILLSVFVIGYTTSEAFHYIKTGSKLSGAVFLVAGILTVILVWLFSVKVIYVFIAFLLFLIGIADIIAGIHMYLVRYFWVFLGIINILISIAILSYPVILPLIIAWYVLWWGLSRLFLVLEIKRTMSDIK